MTQPIFAKHIFQGQTPVGAWLSDGTSVMYGTEEYRKHAGLRIPTSRQVIVDQYHPNTPVIPRSVTDAWVKVPPAMQPFLDRMAKKQATRDRAKQKKVEPVPEPSEKLPRKRTCGLCGFQGLPPGECVTKPAKHHMTRHHFTPRGYLKAGGKRKHGGKLTTWLCWGCHCEIHRLATHKELAEQFYTIELLSEMVATRSSLTSQPS